MKKIYFVFTLISTHFFFGQTNYLVDNFDYVSGTLLSANGWFIHSTGGTTNPNPIAVNSVGLSWTGYIGSNLGKSALVNTSGQDVNRPLGENVSDGSVYASFLFKPSGAITSTSTQNFFFHFLKYSNSTNPDYTSINSAWRARTFVLPGTNSATHFKLGLNFNAGDYISPTNVTADLDLSKTYLIVVKYSFISGDANDTVSLFVFEEGANISVEPTSPTLGPISATTTGSPAAPAPDLDVIQGIALRQQSAGQNAIVDGIYVRKEWNLTSPGTPLGIEQFALNNSFKVYPNPVQNNLISIFSTFEGEKELSIIDMTGKVVFKKIILNTTLDISTVNKGLYLLQTKEGTKIRTTKIVVQ